MRLAVGFGSTEEAFEQEAEKAATDYIDSRLAQSDLTFFDDDLVKDVSKWLGETAAALRAKAQEFDNSLDPPDRYSYFWTRVASSASDIVVIFTFMHINRRHALSPDGWGLLRTTRLVHVSTLDTPRSKQAAA